MVDHEPQTPGQERLLNIPLNDDEEAKKAIANAQPSDLEWFLDMLPNLELETRHYVKDLNDQRALISQYLYLQRLAIDTLHPKREAAKRRNQLFSVVWALALLVIGALVALGVERLFN